MNKRDINALSDIFQRIIMESAGGGVQPDPGYSAEYNIGVENLRANSYTTNSGEPIVLFYTQKISDDQNDVLHKGDGPAVIFGNGGPENEFYFLHGERIDMTTDEGRKKFKAASHEVTYRGHEKETTGKTDMGDLGVMD